MSNKIIEKKSNDNPKNVSNNAKDIKKTNNEGPVIIVIGKEGRIGGNKVPKKSFTTVERYNRNGQKWLRKDIKEFDKTELEYELINPDIQYFLAFCCFLYLLRSFHMSYRVIEEINTKHLDYDFNYDLTIFLVDVFFTIILFSTALNGWLFCWRMNLWFVFPYLMSLFFSSSLMAFRIIAPIIDKNYSLNLNLKTVFSMKIFRDDRIMEAVIDSSFLILNLSISFGMISLYEQICKTERTLNFEPQIIKINGNSFVRIEDQNIILYRLKNATQTKSKDNNISNKT